MCRRKDNIDTYTNTSVLNKRCAKIYLDIEGDIHTKEKWGSMIPHVGIQARTNESTEVDE